MEREKDQYTIYVFWNRMPFGILARHRGMSYDLSKEQFEKLISGFKSNGIPYKTQTHSISSAMVSPAPEPVQHETCDEPYNSRGVFTLDGEEFHILNFDYHLVKRSFAEGIIRDLIKRDIHGRAEVVGSLFYPKNEYKSQSGTHKAIEQKGKPQQPSKREESLPEKKVTTCEQITLEKWMRGSVAV